MLESCVGTVWKTKGLKKRHGAEREPCNVSFGSHAPGCRISAEERGDGEARRGGTDDREGCGGLSPSSGRSAWW
jgi:hypothetical protein